MGTEVVGPSISAFSRAMLKDIGGEATIPLLRVTSVQRTVPEQARALVQKHVIRGEGFNYKNPEVTKLLTETKSAYHDPAGKHHGNSKWATDHIATGIYNLKGGPQSASKHIVTSPYIEVFDISLKGLTSHQKDGLLTACRARYPFPINKLGIPAAMHPDADAGRGNHSEHERKQLRDTFGPQEFKDEDCFHFEVLVPLMNDSSNYMNVA